MAKKTNLSNTQKVAIVREHLIEGVAVSVLCDKHGITPVTYYTVSVHHRHVGVRGWLGRGGGCRGGEIAGLAEFGFAEIGEAEIGEAVS
ncbi:MAG: transposase, partial [Pirellulaceae bacterium]|nr:transposase [Pirellulaceae bacterium]